MYTDVMVDIETFGKTPQAPIIQIGAVAFSRTGNISPPFKVTIKPDFSRYKPDEETILWWLEQSKEARESVISDDWTTREALESFTDWLSTELAYDPIVWAMPPEFDLKILENAFRVEGLSLPWKYNASRDLRTLLDLAGMDKEDRIKPVIPHDAGQDALAQTKTLFKAVERMSGGTPWQFS